MKNDKEIVGTLLGFDDFVNMLLDDVTESEATPEGRRVTKLDMILLNGNNITMVSRQRFLLISVAKYDAGSKKNDFFLSQLQLVPGGEMPET